jgi:hypothetical protein
VRGKGGSKVKVKERENQVESPMGKKRKKNTEKRKQWGLKMVCQS